MRLTLAKITDHARLRDLKGRNVHSNTPSGPAEVKGESLDISPCPTMPCLGEPALLAAGSQHFSFQSLCISFPSSSFLPASAPQKRRMPLLLSTQPVILLSDLSQEVSVVTDCVRIAPLRVITLNSPLKDSSLWIEYKKTPHPPFTEIHDFCCCHWHPGSEALPGTVAT